MLRLLIIEIHSPYICRACGASPLGYEINVTSVPAPDRAEVIGGMVGELRHVGAVQPCYKYVGIHIGERPACNLAASYKQEPFAVGRNDWRGETPLRVGDDAFFRPRLVIDFP